MKHTGQKNKLFVSVLLTAMTLIFSGKVLLAQQQGSNSKGTRADAQQKIEALKVAYLTQQLNLNPGEAQKFWPVYNQYQKELHQLGRERRKNQMNKRELNKASDSQIKSSLDKDFNYQEQALAIKKKYRGKFDQVLPARKVVQLYKAEKDFNLKLIKELRRRQGKEAPATGPHDATRQPADSTR
ncbi:MAG TPA: hypothetical protein VFX43_04010 [Chitinophagaceae bacterium]|jgi:hypothetical protein|nr:hypothetical protein [Chitinophagaceae bacterium]